MRQIGCRVSDELFAAVELARGDVPRERWMRRVFEEACARESDAFCVTDAVMQGAEPMLVELSAAEPVRPTRGATRELYGLARQLRSSEPDALP